MKDKSQSTVGLAKSVLTGIYCSINTAIHRNVSALGKISKIQGSLGTRQKYPLENENLNYFLDWAGPVEHGRPRPGERDPLRKLPSPNKTAMHTAGLYEQERSLSL